MKHLLFLLLTGGCFFIASAQTTIDYIPKFTSGGGAIINSNIYDDNGLIGIGSTAPRSLLNIAQNVSGTEDFFNINTVEIGGTPPNLLYEEVPIFTIARPGTVGIGIAEPDALLHIASYKAWGAYDNEVSEQKKMLCTNADGEPFFFISDMSYNDNGHKTAGFLGLLSAPGAMGLGVFNALAEKIAFGVAGDGILMVNTPIEDPALAQIDIRPITDAGTIVNIGNEGSAPLFSVKEDGGVGVGIDPPFGTFAVKGQSGTAIDVFATASEPWNMQIRMIDGNNIRHIITDDPSSGVDAMIIHPGYAGTSNHRLLIQGDLQTTGNIQVDGTFTIKSSSGKEFKIYNDGKVRAREVQVDLDAIPDYVFDDKYKLTPIEDLATFITENKHLPNVPGECEYEAKGTINLGELNLKLLEKVEELSLYIIQLNDRLKQLEK